MAVSPDADALVSCLTVTKPDRFAFLVRSIADYCAQTYAPRELVIVSSTADASDRTRLEEHLAMLARPDIRVVFIPEAMTLGAARNRSVAEARGRFVCQWDDDDLHHPARLAEQRAALRASGRQACYLQDVFHYLKAEGSLYFGHWGGTSGGVHPGTLFAEKAVMPPYPETGAEARLGEDTAVLRALWERAGFHALAENPHLFIYVTHGRNSWSEAQHRMLVDRLAVVRGELRRRAAAIRASLGPFAFPSDVTVRGLDGPAFRLADDTPAVEPGESRRDHADDGRPTILLAQEFGSNFGHIRRLLTVARALGPARFVVAVPNPAVVAGMVATALGPEVEIAGAMDFRAPELACSPSAGDRTLADVFHNLGYGHRESLDRAVDRWRALVERVRPDLIICEFAPTLRLALWDSIPTVVMGGSYETPPPGMPLPTVVPAGEPPGEVSSGRESALLAAAQAVRRRLGGPPLAAFADLFGGERVFCIVPPGCDPYAPLRREPTFLPFPTPDIRCGPPLDTRTGPAVFCFLWSDHPWLDLILTALNGLPRRSEIHIRGVEPAHLIRQCAPQVGVRPDTADFATLLPQTRVFLHYGGAAASYAGLLAGTVQIIIPIHLEQEMTARGMIANGGAVGLVLDPTATPERLREIIAAVLDNPVLHESARRAAERAHAGRTVDALPLIVAVCRDLLASGAASDG